MKQVIQVVFTLLLLMFWPCVRAEADTITADELAAELTADSHLPMAPGAALLLANNILTAQTRLNSDDCSNYVMCADDPGSLDASIASVLYAINTIMVMEHQTMVLVPTGVDAPQQPFLNSVLPIDPQASIQLSGNGQIIGPGEGISFGVCLIDRDTVCQFPPTVTSFDPPPVLNTPEPRTLWLMLTGLSLLFLAKCRQYPTR